jgi:hypothetical protein
VTRDDKGRFAKGNPGGPGRPTRATEQEYLDVLKRCVGPEDMVKVFEKALDLAIKRGDPSARKWLSDYLLGTPVTRIGGAKSDAPLEIIIRHVRPGDSNDTGSA